MRSSNLLFIVFIFFMHNAEAQKDSISFLALGDSYTIGTGESKENSWPEQFVQSLSKKRITIKSPRIVADAGWTTSKLKAEISKKDLDDDYNLVALLIGVNNQYRGQDFKIFEKEYPELVDISIRLANNRPDNVFLLSIPDWSVTPFAKFKDRGKMAREIEKYNAFIKNEALKRKMLFIDITKISKNAKFDKTLIASDSLHPSRKMYKSWVRTIRKQILKKLK